MCCKGCKKRHSGCHDTCIDFFVEKLFSPKTQNIINHAKYSKTKNQIKADRERRRLKRRQTEQYLKENGIL